MVQSPESARFSEMPLSSISVDHVDRILPPGQIAALLKVLIFTIPVSSWENYESCQIRENAIFCKGSNFSDEETPYAICRQRGQ